MPTRPRKQADRKALPAAFVSAPTVPLTVQSVTQEDSSDFITVKFAERATDGLLAVFVFACYVTDGMSDWVPSYESSPAVGELKFNVPAVSIFTELRGTIILLYGDGDSEQTTRAESVYLAGYPITQV